MLGLGSVGNIGSLIGAVIAIGIMAIVLLTFAPTVAGDVNGIFLEGKSTCIISGERFDQLVKASSATQSSDDAWYEGTTILTMAKPTTGDGCAATVALAGSGTGGTYYTPKGTAVTIADTAITKGTKLGISGTWKQPSKSVTALAGGSLALLLLGATAILIPAGALGFLAWSGAEMVRGYIGGSVLAIAIGATVATVVVGAMLPEIFTPLDKLFIVMDGKRYSVYNEGIGSLAGVLSNFFAISLLAGIVALGGMLWKNTKGNEDGVM